MTNHVLTEMLLKTYLVDLASPACPSAPEHEDRKVKDAAVHHLSVFAADYRYSLHRSTYTNRQSFNVD